MELAIKSNIGLSSNGDNSNINYLIAELSLYPITTPTQTVSNIKYISNPAAQIQESQNKVIYKWENPTLPISLVLTADIRVDSDISKIISKIEFPIQNINYTYLTYIQPAEYTDINDAIKEKANELVSGEDDLYDATFKIAEWVRTNVEYNLSTMTEQVVQKSSWVFVNKQGVCDEITNLFISMVRSIGIPARFVSGIAYTNTEDKWGNHGWAEVYFPGYGWIPFDVTYGQFGWIDPSHIVLDYTIDSQTPSLTLQGSMHNTQFSNTDIQINSNLISKSEKKPELARMDIELFNTEVGVGSYVPLRIKLENLQPYYVPVQLRVTKAPELTENNIKSILLKPRQEKSVFWIVKIPSDTKEGYSYSTLFEIVNSFGGIESEKISYNTQSEVITLDQANQKIKEYTELEELSYSENIDIDCVPEKVYYYDYEKATLLCNVKNIGNNIIKDINVCIEEKCELVSLHISEVKKIIFSDLDSNKQLEVKATNGKVDFKKYFTIKSLSDPKLRISNLKYPDMISYNGIADLQFILSSEAPVKNIEFVLNGNKFYTLQSFSGTEDRIFSVKGNYFYSNSKTKLIINYEDENGYKYVTDKLFLSNVQNVPFYAELWISLKSMFSSS